MRVWDHLMGLPAKKLWKKAHHYNKVENYGMLNVCIEVLRARGLSA